MITNKQKNAVNTQRSSKRVYTKLKFFRSEITGYLIGLVSRNPITGMYCGVRPNADVPKKVCVLDEKLAGQVVLNRLYDCTLIPMKNSNGYVVVVATPTLFDAQVSSTYVKNCIYHVKVKFGNKTILFDPFEGRKASVKDFQTCLSLLKERKDIKDIEDVINKFKCEAHAIIRHLNNDKYQPHNL